MEHRYFDALSRLCRLFYNIAANFLPPTHIPGQTILWIFSRITLLPKIAERAATRICRRRRGMTYPDQQLQAFG